ncbi:MAG: hypothetical protein IPJ37_16935 [Bacteroidales bacterium]|nr:hypothetical protein [Bacteroidales bacterium]
MVARPEKPHDTVDITDVTGTKIDSAFIGSCTNGRMSDMYSTAEILRGRKVAPAVVLKIVPSTDSIWKQCPRRRINHHIQGCRCTRIKCRLCWLCCRTGWTERSR